MPKVQRRKDVWEGKNRFWCGGRLVGGPDRNQFYIAIFFILLPLVPFMGAIWPYLFWAVTEMAPLFAVFFMLHMLLLFLTFYWMLRTAYMDPGIIPRCPQHLRNIDLEYGKEIPTRTLMVNGQEEVVKYCLTCHIWRPPRTIHCGVCGNCVEKYDHHCPWVGNCIGQRNYPVFILFIHTLILNIIFSAFLCFSQLAVFIYKVIGNKNSGEIIWSSIAATASVITLIYLFTAFAFVGFLTAFHCTVISQNLTTNEKCKKKYVSGNPHSQGCLSNYLLLFTEPHVGYVDFTEQIEDVMLDDPVKAYFHELYPDVPISELPSNVPKKKRKSKKKKKKRPKSKKKKEEGDVLPV